MRWRKAKKLSGKAPPHTKGGGQLIDSSHQTTRKVAKTKTKSIKEQPRVAPRDVLFRSPPIKSIQVPYLFNPANHQHISRFAPRMGPPPSRSPLPQTPNTRIRWGRGPPAPHSARRDNGGCDGGRRRRREARGEWKRRASTMPRNPPLPSVETARINPTDLTSTSRRQQEQDPARVAAPASDEEAAASASKESKGGGDEEDEETCGFCKFMKGGACKDVFVVRTTRCREAVDGARTVRTRDPNADTPPRSACDARPGRRASTSIATQKRASWTVASSR